MFIQMFTKSAAKIKMSNKKQGKLILFDNYITTSSLVLRWIKNWHYITTMLIYLLATYESVFKTKIKYGRKHIRRSLQRQKKLN